MKQIKSKLLFTMAAVVFSSSVFADCVSLDYQEMKDMTVTELKKEFCGNHAEAMRIFESSFNLFIAGVNTTNDGSDARKGKCSAEAERIGRILTQKGVVEPSYKTLCIKAE